MSLRNLLHPVVREFDSALISGNEVEILQEIPVETLYLALKEADTETSLWLFSNARPEQIQGLIDLDCWNGDEFLPDRFDPYFKTFSLLSPPKLQEYMKWVDPEIIVRGLMNYCQVVDYDPQNPPEYPESQILLSPDSKYALLLNESSPDVREALYLWLDKFSAVDMPLLHRHLESCKWEQPSDLEEFAYNIKRGRLEDMGFVDRQEALSLYAVGSAAELKKQLLESPLPPGTKREAAGNQRPQTEDADVVDLSFDFLPEIVKESSGGESFFGNAFAALDTKALRDLVMMEIVRTINASLMADESLHKDLPQIQELSDKAKAYLNIGLAYLSDQKADIATKYLENIPVTSIYRLGWLVVYDLTKAAGQVQKSISLDLWPTLDREFLEGLRGRHPSLPPHLMLDLGAGAGTQFLKIETLFLAGQRLKHLAQLSDFFFQKMGTALRILEKPQGLSDNLYSRLLTGLFREASEGEFDSKAMSLNEWADRSKAFSSEKLTKAIHFLIPRVPEPTQGLFEKRIYDLAEELNDLVKKYREKGLMPQPRFARSVVLSS